MTLAPGTKLGPFEIVAPLGAGGMGDVYRARDPRLGRDVAIKALPAAFAADPERLARFEREAKLLASLSHPNIAGIHGLEEVAGHRYLVLELVEGETLASRLARGPLPIDETLEIAKQIAAAVEAAHENGVIHRDLKPGNVMLKPDGTVKVLDFGLAKGGAASGSGSDPNLSASPTLTHLATNVGVILGTAAYMSPEQARGKSLDRRTDIWSFGCVLYECLTGRPAFGGETVSDVVAHILAREPDWSALPGNTPPRLIALLKRCLTRDAKQRQRDIGDARLDLDAIAAGETGAAASDAASIARTRGVPLGVAVLAALFLVTAAVLVTLRLRPAPAPAPVRKFDLVAQGVEADWFFSAALSPDGRRIAYIAKDHLWLRDLADVEPRAVAEVEELAPVFWSPDGGWLGFCNGKKLWKVAVESGVPTAICDVAGTGTILGATWSRTGTVTFSVWRGAMFQVSAEGGTPKLLFDIDPATLVDFHTPSSLPNGDLLYVRHWREAHDSTGALRPNLMLFDGRTQTEIPGDFGGVTGTPTYAGGKLLYIRHGTNAGIWAVPFDLARHRTTAEPVLVAPGAASLSVAGDGSLLYMEGATTGAPNEMIWVDRSGRVTETVGSPYPGLTNAVLSPDGRKVAFATGEDKDTNIWVRDLVRGIDTRLTFGAEKEGFPLWLSPSRLSYIQVAGMKVQTLAVNADGSGGQTVIAVASEIGREIVHFAPDGKTAALIVDDRGQGRLRVAPVLPDGSLGPRTRLLRMEPEPDVNDLSISPDGRFLAYATNDPGQPDVFLTRFPSGEGQWQVDQEGGRRPVWARGTGELFYIAGGGPSRRALVAVPVDPSQDPPLGTPAHLFDIDPSWLHLGEMPYDVTADGTRFLMVREAAGHDAKPRRMVLVQHWETELANKGKR
jgi:eukaryotic-like serine/threonine-protein kinase